MFHFSLLQPNHHLSLFKPGLTDDVWVIDSLQDLRLLVQTVLVNGHLLGCTITVDLLHSPGRRIQLLQPGKSQNNKKRVSYDAVVA